MVGKNGCRVFFFVVILVTGSAFVFMNHSTANDDPFNTFREQVALEPEAREPLAGSRSDVTAISSEAGALVAIDRAGEVLYFNDSHDGYWDIDPNPEGETTVTYSATEKVKNSSLCRPLGRENYCVRQMIERMNLTTGNVTRLYSRIDPRYHYSEWHDVQQVNESHYVVADMFSDEVFIVNTTSGLVVWEWNAQNHLSLDTGNEYPKDWVHLNDVELLPDGRIMVSLRNQDQVVFLSKEGKVIDEFTLGREDEHSILYEQHNPDYIPEEKGGPAVLVADSENNRIVEYQWSDSTSWSQSWSWRDNQVQWPRDADRLPNAHTLITDTHGGRVIEIDRRGDIVWSIDVPLAYDSERLATGEESSGPSATAADLRSRVSSPVESTTLLSRIRSKVINELPNKWVNALEHVLPLWMGFYDFFLFVVCTLTLFIWLTFEGRWSNVRIRSPFVRKE